MPEEPAADQTRARCQVILDGLDIPEPFELSVFVAYVASLRGRRISVMPFRAGPDGMTGTWIQAPSADYIYHDDQTTAVHQAHIVVHEVAHMLLEHNDAGLILAELCHMPAAGAVLADGGRYSCAQERDAETLASMLLERANRPRASRPRVRDAGRRTPEITLVIERIDNAIGGGTGTIR